MKSRPRPSLSQLRAARSRVLRDVVRPGLTVLFCGINPGLYSAATGFHFARPGNRFWPALHRSGFTARQLAPWETRELLDAGYGITNLAARTTAAAAELSVDELREGRRRLVRKVRRLHPRWVAVVGITAYRAAFERPKAALGEQAERIAGARIWVLPNPSGLNAHHRLPDIVRHFRALRDRCHERA